MKDVALLVIEEMIVDPHQDLEKMKTRVLSVKEMKDVALLVIEEMIVDHPQSSREVTTRALLGKKTDHLENLLDLKKNLLAAKKNRLINFKKNSGNLPA